MYKKIGDEDNDVRAISTAEGDLTKWLCKHCEGFKSNSKNGEHVLEELEHKRTRTIEGMQQVVRL